ncbi:MAG TPA: hypothetical protein VD713_00065 [Sphingomonadales bacterium]|nr:hypothetical protein [Sphingomonadales bacterium]
MRAEELQKKMHGRNLALLAILLAWAVLLAVLTYVKLGGLA